MMGHCRNILIMGYHTEEYETMDKVQHIVILSVAGADVKCTALELFKGYCDRSLFERTCVFYVSKYTVNFSIFC